MSLTPVFWMVLGEAAAPSPSPVWALLTNGTNVYITGGRLPAPQQIGTVPNGFKADLGSLAVSDDGRWMAIFSDAAYAADPTVITVAMGDADGLLGTATLSYAGGGPGVEYVGAMAYGQLQVYYSDFGASPETYTLEVWSASESDGSVTLSRTATNTAENFPSYWLNASTLLDITTAAFVNTTGTIINTAIWRDDLAALIDGILFREVVLPTGTVDLSDLTGGFYTQRNSAWVGSTLYRWDGNSTGVLGGTVQIVAATVAAGTPWSITGATPLDPLPIPAPDSPSGWLVRAVQYRGS